MRILLIGESNPYGGPDRNALVPYPDGCSGWRLCHVVLGMTEEVYIDTFDRVNLVRGPWRIDAARMMVDRIKMSQYDRLVLLGAKVALAFKVPYVPFTTEDGLGWRAVVWPHPSGRNHRMWTPEAIAMARAQIVTLGLA